MAGKLDSKQDIIAYFLSKLEEKDLVITELQKMIVSLQDTLTALKQTIEEQTALIEQLNQTIAELREKKNKNSRNSSKPPSSDGPGKPNPKSLREKSGKSKGGQKGHEGSTLFSIGKPDETIPHMPSQCLGCPHFQKCKGKACPAEKRSIVDATIDIKVIEHQVLEVACPLQQNEMLRGAFPDYVKAPIQYGDNIQALVTVLNTEGALSINRIHEIFGNVFQIPLSTGAISQIVKRGANAVSSVYKDIKAKMEQAELSHFDESGIRVDGKTKWVHVASNSEYTYLFLHEKRGSAAMDEKGTLPAFEGIAVHDCWKPYWKYPVTHAVCNAHLLRELNGVIENHPEQTWAAHLKALLLDMHKAKEEAICIGEDCLDIIKKWMLETEYDICILEGFRQNPLEARPKNKKGKPKKGKVIALLERFQKLKASVCLFINNFKVPFSNNQAEQDIRFVKIKSKVSGCFRTDEGANDYLKLMSYISTAKKGGYNAFWAIQQAFAGRPHIILEQGT